YSDDRYQGKQGILSGNSIVFELDDYYGSEYRILYVYNIDKEVSIGDEINIIANLEIDFIDRGNAEDTLLITNPNFNSSITTSTVNRVNFENYISFSISTKNTGNEDLLDFNVEINVPDEITLYNIKTGSFMIDKIEVDISKDYIIDYEINNKPTPIQLGTYNTDKSQNVDLPPLLENEKITKLIWKIPNFPVGTIKRNNIILNGIVTSINEENIINYVSSVNWIENNEKQSLEENKNILISNKSELNVKKYIQKNIQTVIPTQIIRCVINFKAQASQINNPIIIDLLSEKLEYLGNDKYTFYDYFDNKTINSSNPNFYEIVPIQKEVIKDFKNSNKTLLRYTIDDFSLRQNSSFTIEFDTTIKIGATGNIKLNALIGNIDNNAIAQSGYTPYLDENDLDNDNIYDEYIIIGNEVNISILYYAGLSSNKKVKGAFDLNYSEEPNIGLTYEGGSVDYKLVIKNIGNLIFKYIEIVDILPHIDDSGVILVNSKRKSEFNIYNISTIKAYIMEDNIIVDDANLLIYYSTSYDPVRFSKNNFGNDLIGTDNDWFIKIPDPITDTKSVKVVLDNLDLLPNQELVIYIRCLAPVGVESEKIAWNSIAIKSSYENEYNKIKNLLPVEPEKVGVKIKESQKGSISGTTWLDKNKDGNIGDEIGLNGITVRLYSKDNIFLKETVTTNDAFSNFGRYKFNDLDYSTYYIHFISNNNLYITRYNSYSDNKARSNTSLTDFINLSLENKSIKDINAGFINGIDIISMLLELLYYNIYSQECNTLEDIINNTNYVIANLINILNQLKSPLIEGLQDNIFDDVSYKAHLQRLLYTLNDLIFKLSSININNHCNNNIISQLIYILVEIILNIISIALDNQGLNKYYLSNSYCSCELYENIVFRFINNINKLDENIVNLNKILG
ncbi:MAG: SdrD B-like domain-containing protein, partial [Peptostreptococcaceae bacterium]